MSDLLSVLEGARAGAPTAINDDVVAADIVRGRQARGRVRRRRMVTGAVAVLTASAAIVTAIGVDSGEPAPGPVMAQSESPDVSPVRLVAYAGADYAGFTLAVVPEGWTLRALRPHFLLIGKRGSLLDPSDRKWNFLFQPDGLPDGYAGYPAGMSLGLGTYDPAFDGTYLQRTDLRINGEPASIIDHDGIGDRVLYFEVDGKHVRLSTMFGSVTNAQLVEFAKGVGIS